MPTIVIVWSAAFQSKYVFLNSYLQVFTVKLASERWAGFCYWPEFPPCYLQELVIVLGYSDAFVSKWRKTAEAEATSMHDIICHEQLTTELRVFVWSCSGFIGKA